MKKIPALLTLLTFLLSSVAPVLAADLIAELGSCRAITSDADRVACYDALADAAAPALPDTASTAAIPETPVAAPPPTIPAEPVVAADVVPAAAVVPEAEVAPAAEINPEAEVAPAAEIKPAAEESFGKSSRQIEREQQDRFGQEDIRELEATVAKLRKMGNYKLEITLDNGQRWHQITSSYLRLKVGDAVVIKRAALDSYKLVKVGNNRAMKVRRVN